jgi:Ca2+-binding EF-hand superfamily protein
MLVNLAFDVLDKDGSNQIDPLDLVGVYDTSKHPDVISRKKTTQEVLRDFLDGFDVGGEVDGMVTRQEFENYYANVSSSIDDDQYFELMIRNAWHISGGEGQAANSANRRVLVTRADGSEYVEEIKNDLGLKQEDRAGAMARLSAQGVVASSVSLYGSAGNIQSPRMTRPDSASIVSRLRNQAVANRMDRTPAAPLPPTPAPSVTLLDVARSGPQGDYGLPPTRPVTANFTANKKMFTDTNSATAKDALLGSPSKVFTNPRQLPPAGLGLLIDRLKSALKARGAGGFAALEKMFESMDEDGNGTLSVAELKSVMKKLNLPVLESDVRQIFEYFDKDQSGSIDSSEFMEGIRDPLTAKRLALVDMAFTELDYDGTGEVLFETIASMYNVEMHPEVVAGRLSPKSALANFLETFDGGIEIEGVVTRTEFRNYYCNVGASIDSDDYFDLLLRGVWNLHEGDSALYDNSNFRNSVSPRSVIHGQVGATASSPSARSGLVSASAVRVAPKGLSALTVTSSLSLSPQKARASTAGTAFPPPNDTMSKAAPYYSYTYGTEKPLSASAAAAAKVLGTRLNPASRIPDNGLLHLIARMKADIISRGPIGFTSLQRVFQTADINGDGTLTLAEFKCALQSMRLNISQSEVRLLFQYFDADDSGTLCFTEFVGGLRNDLNPARLTVVKEAFRKLDTKRCGSVEIADITKAFNPSHHPDVLAGQQTTRQAMATFLDTFDAGGDIPGRVTESEFINYYTNIGALIDVDEEFDLVLRGVWGLGWEVKTAPVVVTYETKTCSNAPASSLREGMLCSSAH